jgi:hypothetical protein
MKIAHSDTISRTEIPDWIDWYAVRLGTHRDIPSLRKALDMEGYSVDHVADDILWRGEFDLSAKLKTIGIVIVSVKALGLLKGAAYDEICRTAEAMGLTLCPAEVGPQLRLQLKPQHGGRRIRIAMQPLWDSHCRRCIFGVVQDATGRRLSWYFGSPEYHYDPEREFAFCLSIER